MEPIIKKVLITVRLYDSSETYSVESSGLDRAWYEENGYLVLEEREILIQPRTREELVPLQVAALKKKQVAVQAEATKKVTDLQGEINRLLQLEYVEAGEFAPRRKVDNVTDVDPF